uniref:carbonic anhydrase n=1 Tax=Archivesica packardana TaxID=1299447 RepID=A0A5P8D247_9BIVA|nr:carbonic anhydrase [Archivesica packardana]
MGFIVGLTITWALLIQIEAAKWGYVNDRGPDHWADLFPDACSGSLQSPINIPTKQTVYDPMLKDFAIFFDPPSPGSKFFVHNNGHSIQVNTEGKFYVSNGGLDNIYSTAQFHFHWGHKAHHGSEHTIDGKPAPIEMHIVNWNSDKYNSIAEAAVEPAGLAVLGILFEISDIDNPILEPLVNVLKHVRDPDKQIKAEIPAVAMRTFLPRAPNMYYRYNGSLTTPGCFESVIWTVFYQKQTISRRQLHVFRQVLKPTHHRNKRSPHHESRAVRAVMEELGIEDNYIEKARFKRQLQDKAATETKDTTVVEASAQHEPSGTDTHSTSSTNHNVKSEPMTSSHADKVRNMLVNNYRPVQPLNGRIIYRSFPFFGEPIPAGGTEVIYLDIDGSEGQNNTASTLRDMSLLTTFCSILISKLL